MGRGFRAGDCTNLVKSTAESGDKNAELGQWDSERGQYLAVRMRGDFSVVWSHPIPAGDFNGRIRSQALDNGSLLFAENSTLVGLDQDGNVFNWSAVRNCQLISTFSKNNQIRLLCQESSHPGTPWELRELDEKLQITKRFFLPNNTGKYGALTAAGDLSRDRFAVVAINGYYSDLLVFDKSGKELKVVSLPTRMELHRSSADILDFFPQDSGVVAVARSIQEFLQFSSDTINWIFVGTE